MYRFEFHKIPFSLPLKGEKYVSISIIRESEGCTFVSQREKGICMCSLFEKNYSVNKLYIRVEKITLRTYSHILNGKN